jgi:hypothetical protein
MIPLSAGVHLGGEHTGILRPVIAHRSQDDSLLESGSQKLLQEGTAFPGAGDSGKPFVLAVNNLRGKGFA